MRKFFLSLTVGITAVSAAAYSVDFDKINHWSGSGSNRTALVIQFHTNETENPGALVWGLKWETGEELSGVDLVTRIAEEASGLFTLIQMTGPMGYTLDGIGYSPENKDMLSSLTYDFEGATADQRISFGFFDPNTSMGQTWAPGNETVEMIMNSIEDASGSHVILHPLNYEEFGYPAYDYDWWNMNDNSIGIWNSGWYDGYWSYWVGSEGDLDNLGYSGLGMSSVKLKDGDVHGWKYNDFSSTEDDWLEPVYVEGVPVLIYKIEEEQMKEQYYSMEGLPLSTPPEHGFYISRKGNKVSKKYIK